MESDLIRAEIDATSRRLARNLEHLELRATRTARSALAWTVAVTTAAAFGLFMTALIRRRRSRRRAAIHPTARHDYPAQRILPFERLQRVRREGPRSSA